MLEHLDYNEEANPKSSDQHLTLLIHPDGSVSLDPNTPTEDASTLFLWFLQFARIVTEEPELALEIFQLPREGAVLRDRSYDWPPKF